MNILQRLAITLGLAVKAFCLKIFLCGSLDDLSSIREPSDLLAALERREEKIRSEMASQAYDQDDYQVMEMRLSTTTSWVGYLHCVEEIRDLWS